MQETLTLPDLQALLDQLEDGQALCLARADYDRLFGSNDAGRGRLANFAHGHGCTTIWQETGLIFRRHADRAVLTDRGR